MQRLKVTGGYTLEGETRPGGSKNAALPLLVAPLLCDQPCTLHKVPRIRDVDTIFAVMRALGVRIERLDAHSWIVDASNLNSVKAPHELVSQMRASFYVAGPLIARWHEAEVALPGGCSLGPRPVDFHLQAFQKLGAEVAVDHGYMRAQSKGLIGAHIELDSRYSSVGTTVNAMMAATLAKGTTTIEYAARDPEVVETASMLRAMGARISGDGTPVLTIEGVEKLHGCEWNVPPDRIETGTLLIAAVATQGDVVVRDTRAAELEALLAVLKSTGAELRKRNGTISLRMNRRPAAAPDIIRTAPYPGFPTDLQPLVAAMLATAEGVSTIEETIFTNRFLYVDELNRMGANIQVSNQTAVIRGVPVLSAAPVYGPDLRAGAALLVAALTAEGCTELSGCEHLERGYEDLDRKLVELGAFIERVDDGASAEEPSN